MPYASTKQARFMHAKHPQIARRWDAEIRAARSGSKKIRKRRHPNDRTPKRGSKSAVYVETPKGFIEWTKPMSHGKARRQVMSRIEFDDHKLGRGLPGGEIYDIFSARTARMRGKPSAYGGVLKGLKRDVALGLMTGTIGGVAANQLPQNQTPTKVPGKLKKTGRKGRVAKAAPEISVAGLGAARRERRKATAQAVGLGGVSAATGAAGLGLTAARWTPKSLTQPVESATPKITQKVRQAAGKSPAPAAERAAAAFHASKPGKRFAQVGRWAKKNPKTATAAALGLKGASLGAGLASRFRREEASGLSHEIGTTRGVKRHQREIGKAATYEYLETVPARIGGDGGGMPIRNPIKPMDALAAANLINMEPSVGQRIRLGRRRARQESALKRSYGMQMQTSLGVGRAQR